MAPKRSRSSSPVPPPAKVDEQAPSMPISTSDSSPAPSPKHFRASKSPPPSISSEETPVPHPMQCALPPHAPLTLLSAAAFDIHYAQEHTNRCTECNANLPSAWILELHLNEKHNPLIAAQRDKEEKTYRCFLSDCEKVTSTPEKRRLHLIDKHKYPRNYDFKMVERGIGKRPSVLRGGNVPPHKPRRRVSEVGEPHWQSNVRDRAGDVNHGQHTPQAQDGPANQKPQEALAGAKSKFTQVKKTSTTGPNKGSQEAIELRETTRATDRDPKAPKEGAVASDDIDTITSTLSSLQFVPMSVRLKDKKKTQ